MSFDILTYLLLLISNHNIDMPQPTHLDDNEETEWTWSADDGADNPFNSLLDCWRHNWALAGHINWNHKDINLSSIPFAYTPNPFLANFPFPEPSSGSNLAGITVTSLPLLGPGDRWVMVDPYWRHEMLGWMERREDEESGSRPYGVSATTIEVGNLLYDSEDTDHMNLKGYVYCLFRPAGVIVSLTTVIGRMLMLARYLGAGQAEDT